MTTAHVYELCNSCKLCRAKGIYQRAVFVSADARAARETEGWLYICPVLTSPGDVLMCWKYEPETDE